MSNTEFGGIVTWFLLAYTISQSVSGKLYDRVGTRLGCTFSIIIWSAAAMAHAFARSLTSLSAFRFVLGFGEAGNWPGAAKAVAEWFPVRQRAFGMAIFNSGAAIGSMAPPLIVWLQLRYGWQTTFLVTGLLGIFWLVLWLLFYQPPNKHKWITEEERSLIIDGRHVALDAETEAAVHPRADAPIVEAGGDRGRCEEPRRRAALALLAAASAGVGDHPRTILYRSDLVALHHLAPSLSLLGAWL
ncbi:hypothetical protein BH20ACI3_BH20ACI3_33440 [soil metagenome]